MITQEGIMGKRDAKAIAKILSDFYKENFYGKEDSKYRIKKAQVADLAGGSELSSDLVKEIRDELRKLGYVWVKLVDEYIVLEEGPLHRCRAVKKDMIKELTKEKKNKKKR